MQKITPFLWFDDQAEEAVSFYVSIFKTSKVVTVSVAAGLVSGGIMGEKKSALTIALLGVLISIFAASSTVLLAEPPLTFTTVTSVVPATGRPEGGEVVIISGTGFRSPVRVVLRTAGQSRDAFIMVVTPTQIEIITPAVTIPGEVQAIDAQVDVVTQAGTPNEAKVTAHSPFRYQKEHLTPAVTAVSPAGGPISGGARVTIIGEGFQAPVQIFLGDAEAQVVSVAFNQVTAISPASSVVGTVDIRVVNINSSTSTIAVGAYRYFPNIGITAIGPAAGPDGGGTRLRIAGAGFEDPLAITVAGVPAVIDHVSATEIDATTAPRIDDRCSDHTGPIEVFNIDTGAYASGPNFTYLVSRPAIASIDPPIVQEGKQVRIRIAGRALPARFTIGGIAVDTISATANPDDTTTFVLAVLTAFEFPDSLESPGERTRSSAISVDAAFMNQQTTCADTPIRGLMILPEARPSHRPQ